MAGAQLKVLRLLWVWERGTVGVVGDAWDEGASVSP